MATTLGAARYDKVGLMTTLPVPCMCTPLIAAMGRTINTVINPYCGVCDVGQRGLSNTRQNRFDVDHWLRSYLLFACMFQLPGQFSRECVTVECLKWLAVAN